MSFRDDWTKEKERKRLERDVTQFNRRMSAPIARGEVFQFGEVQLQHLASLALAIEALEELLIASGVLKPDELMARMKVLADRKAEQASAAAAAHSSGNLIAQV